MKRLLSFLVWAVLFLSAGSTPAEEPPYLDFVRALRENRRAPDLALDYLQELVKKPSLPKDLLPLLTLEMANSRVDLAQMETAPNAKTALYSQAEKEYRAFLANNPTSPLAAGANLQLARIVAQQGRAQLSLALRQESKEAKRVEEEKARAKFQAAGDALAAASPQIEAQLQKPGLSPTERKALLHDRILARFEEGVGLFYQALTYPDVASRSVTISKAREVLQKASAAGDDKTALYWEARAWLGRCYAETDDPKNADTEFSAVIKHEGPEAEPGKRMALYFRLRFLDRDPSIKGDRSKLIETEGTKWLKSYPEYENSPEGYAVRFLLANTYVDQARRIANQKSAEASALYTKAETLLDAIERTDNDYTQEAHDLKLRTIFKRSSELSGGDINKLASFQDCFVRAQAEIYQMREEGETAPTPDNRKEFEAKRQKHYDHIIQALTRALDLVDEKVPAKDQSEAQYLLTYVLLTSGEAYRAALLGEELARREPKSNRAAHAAGYALQAYSDILYQEEQQNAPKPFLDADRDRIRKLAVFMEANWPHGPAANLARHQLGKLALQDKNYAEAIDSLARITADYPGYTFSQYQLALFAAYPAMKDKVAPPQGQSPSYFQDQALAALRRIPEPAPDTDSGTVKYYLLGKHQLAFLLLGARQFQEMQQVTAQLQKIFKDAKVDEDFRKAMDPAMASLATLAEYSKAEVAYRAGQYDQVKKVVDPMLKDVVSQIKAGKDAETKAQRQRDDLEAALQKKIEKNEQVKDEEHKKLENLKDTVKGLELQNHRKGQLLRSLLILALRAKVQEGDTKQAQEVFDLLKSSSDSFEGGANGVFLEIVQQLKTQIGELEKDAAKDQAKKKDLEKLVAGFTTFLDQMAAQPAALPEDLVGFVANSYSGMRKHAKAAVFLAKYPSPVPSRAPPNEKPEDKEKREQEDKRKEGYYRHVRLLYVRELRLDKQFDKAGAEMKVILNDWGKNNLDAWKEQIFILEDQGKFAAAGNLCNKVMREKLRPYLNKDNRLTDQYYECYYHLVYCHYHLGMKQTDAEKKRENIERAAKLILELERKKVNLSDYVKKMFDDLLSKERVLKKYYDEQKKPQKAAQR
jgi:hypothetical protein